MMEFRSIAAWLRPLAGLFALAGVLALTAGIYWQGTLPAIPAGQQLRFNWSFTSGFGNAFVTTSTLTIFSGSPLAKVFQKDVDIDVVLNGGTPKTNINTLTLPDAIPAGSGASLESATAALPRKASGTPDDAALPVPRRPPEVGS